MQRCYFVFLLLCAWQVPAFASCGGGLAGTAVRGSLYIGYGDCDYDQEMIEYTLQGEEIKRFTFQSQCRWDASGKVRELRPSRGFVCRKAGDTPLAGVKYSLVVKHAQKDACGNPPRLSYRCVQNCTPLVPTTIDFVPVECDG